MATIQKNDGINGVLYQDWLVLSSDRGIVRGQRYVHNASVHWGTGMKWMGPLAVNAVLQNDSFGSSYLDWKTDTRSARLIGFTDLGSFLNIIVVDYCGLMTCWCYQGVIGHIWRLWVVVCSVSRKGKVFCESLHYYWMLNFKI